MKKVSLVFLILLCFAFSVFAQSKTADDPAYVGVGARPLGMGKAYVGLADDVNAIFLNPSGLSQLNHWQITSLSGRLLNEVSYVTLGAAIPTSRGVFGIGYLSSDFGFTVAMTTLEAGTVTTTNETVSYADNDTVILLSYATPLGMNSLSFGTTLKMFFKKLSTSADSGGTASGYDLDLGFSYLPHSALRVGLVAQNVVPSSMGGKIKWNTGLEETLPLTIKGGLSLKCLGREGLRQFEDQRLLLNLDTDFHPTRSHLPNLIHFGLEWSPLRFLDLRFGIDQDTISSAGGGVGVINNFTAGMGLKHGKFRFDYAYHQFEALPGMSNHFFALSYGLFQEEDVKKQEKKLEKERLERERLEKERREKERLERKRKERERMERERREKERRRRELEAKKRKELEERLRREALERERRALAQLVKRPNIFENIGSFFGGAGNLVAAAGQNIAQGFGNALGALGNAGSNIGKTFGKTGEFFSSFGETVKGVFVRPEPEKDLVTGDKVRPKKIKTITLRESVEVLRKVIVGEMPLSELGSIIPQIAASLLILAIKMGLFLAILLLLFVIFREWEKRTG